MLKKLIKEKTKREYQENRKATKEKKWKEKALHGQYTKIADKTDRKNEMNEKWIHEKVNRRTDHNSTRPGTTNKMEKSEYRKATWNTSMQNV